MIKIWLTKKTGNAQPSFRDMASQLDQLPSPSPSAKVIMNTKGIILSNEKLKL